MLGILYLTNKRTPAEQRVLRNNKCVDQKRGIIRTSILIYMLYILTKRGAQNFENKGVV